MNRAPDHPDLETAIEHGAVPASEGAGIAPRTDSYPLSRWLGFGAVLLLMLIGLTVYACYPAKYRFDSVLWKATQGSDPARVFMVDDLLRRHPLVGMSRAEVDELLGRPPATDYFRDFEYVYWLGPERGYISIDSEWLGLRFEQDRVAEARVLSD